MSISFTSDAAAVQQPKNHKTAKHVVNAGVTGATLYGLYKGTAYLMEPFQDAVVSGKAIKYPTGKISSKLCKYFDRAGKMLLSDAAVEKMAKKRYHEFNPEVVNKFANKYKAARGAVALFAFAALNAIPILAAGICRAVKINKESAAGNSRFTKNSTETDNFMQKTMDDIAINQMEVKLSILKDKMTAYDTTPEQRAALKQEYAATKKEYEEAKQAMGIA